MRLEEQVCSLELAQKLKTLGVKQESCFGWQAYRRYLPKGNGNITVTIDDGFVLTDVGGEIFDWTKAIPEAFSAFTVAELYEIYKGVTKEGFILQGTGNQADYLAGEIVYLLAKEAA